MKQLEMHLGMSEREIDKEGNRGTIGKVLKSSTDWMDSEGKSGNGNNKSGFNAFPAASGYQVNFEFLGFKTTFWSSSSKSARLAWTRGLSFFHKGMVRWEINKDGGYSCRCVKN